MLAFALKEEATGVRICSSAILLGKDRVISRKVDLNRVSAWLFPSMGGILETLLLWKS